MFGGNISVWRGTAGTVVCVWCYSGVFRGRTVTWCRIGVAQGVAFSEAGGTTGILQGSLL